ncbi:MAG: TRIC cation channel family protein [Uliginosibacterium sp.]|jgi:uncharacterized membrane protein YeiH|nr:TRIC cation channel family protein [Uliginosibacterium sp.]
MITTTTFFYWIALAGVALYAITGALEAGHKGMDFVGACAAGLATAAGGGTVRDLLIGRPVFWISDPSYLSVAIIAALAAFALARTVRLPMRLFLIPDALALALFTVSGTQTALAAGVPWLVAGLMGVITGVLGGVLRDVLCNEIPLIFLPSELYATAAAAGAATVVGLHAAGLGHEIAAIAGFLVAAGLRLAAMAFRLRTLKWEPRQ